MHPGRCLRCGQKIEPGDAIHYYPPVPGGRPEVAHVECPESEPTPSTFAGWIGDTASLYELAVCSECGEFWAARKAVRGGLPAASPCCGAPWEAAT
jgi:hypothetical protein